METTRDHHRLQVSLTYPWAGTRRKRCFEVRDGEPVPVPCANAAGDPPARLGDGVAAATKAAGVRPCNGCLTRQAWLNQLDALATALAYHLTYPVLPKGWRRGWRWALRWRWWGRQK